jgi:hypothetical protein
MEKIDLKKQLKAIYSPSAGKITVVDVPAMNFIMLDGKGDPNTSQQYVDAIQALYGLSYTIKFDIKKSREIDYTVMPLEGIWWSDNLADFNTGNKSNWKWTAMIMQPEFVTPALFESAKTAVLKKTGNKAVSTARLETFKEGPSVQTLYVGPYSAEGPTIQSLHDYAREHGYTFDGLKQKHHEIYLGNPQRTAPEKLKTVIRQPVIKV